MKEKILSVLKSSNEYISGEQISEMLGISRTAVWKYINKLRGDGYEINSVTNKGYKLVYAPDVLTASLISDGLETDFFAHNVCCYDEITSTNLVAKQNSAEDDGTLFIADMQTEGRGRLGRKWESAKGMGIWMSILLKPDMELADVPQITLAAGLGVCTALNSMFGLNAKIKWPNDIVVGTKKICGIITELSADTDGINYVVAGIGINVNNVSFNDELAGKATSVYIETGKRAYRHEIVRRVMCEFERYYKILETEGFWALRSAYKNLCININRDVLVIKQGIQTRAYCVDITSKGNLLVDIEGSAFEINSGEVSVRGIYGYV